MNRILWFPALALALGCSRMEGGPAGAGDGGREGVNAMENRRSTGKADWKAKLTPEQYRVLRQCGTERPFTGKYWNHHGEGVYRCAGCGQELFDSKTKFDSGSGWPSFWAPANRDRVTSRRDSSCSMVREEILCSGCGGHLGHVFPDGPEPTGLRYCVNSAALDFAPGGPGQADAKREGKEVTP